MKCQRIQNEATAGCILLEVFGRIVAKRARTRFGKLSPEELRRFQESAYKANQ